MLTCFISIKFPSPSPSIPNPSSSLSIYLSIHPPPVCHTSAACSRGQAVLTVVYAAARPKRDRETISTPENIPPQTHTRSARRPPRAAAAHARTFARTLTHIPTYPAGRVGGRDGVHEVMM